MGISSFDFYKGQEVETPFFVQQYFHKDSSSDTGYDPSKHAIALTYLISILEQPEPKNEASKFLWINEDQIPENAAYNHGLALKQAFKFLKNIS